mmetsp:Transcript_28128/g.40275  ORF Transcript_28128/g.40275 Transcript_28128/m.40275 type:complete len:86 (+) Transcript_28128:707-964(+)
MAVEPSEASFKSQSSRTRLLTSVVYTGGVGRLASGDTDGAFCKDALLPLPLLLLSGHRRARWWTCLLLRTDVGWPFPEGEDGRCH